MPIYQWATGDGSIVEMEYVSSRDTLTSDEVETELINALHIYRPAVDCHQVSGDLNEVYEATIPDGEEGPFSILICIKATTPGGRSELTDEQRIQQKSKYLQYAYQQKQLGRKAVSLGVYRRDGVTVFCAWKLKPSRSSPETPISSQIKIGTIASAIREGFAIQKRGAEFAVAFRSEFIYFYFGISNWIHDAQITELPDHIPFIEVPAEIDESLAHKFNRIVFGAPGTGKSYRLEQDRCDFGDNYERVTFHPNYSYAQFVGTYKPVPITSSVGEESITYAYTPGPFMRLLTRAMKDPEHAYLLIIEEINRANVAAVFGDIFQLLDRKDGVSEFPIETSMDMRNYIAEELGGAPEDFKKIWIPKNLYIWATMNSADQGVFPVDTAFKRRWDFEYLSIDEGEGLVNKRVRLSNGHIVNWNELRKAINKRLIELKINEDKLLGPFFLGTAILEDDDEFNDAFKTKPLMYLYEDAAKQYRADLFTCDHGTYSSVCKAYDEQGEGIFSFTGLQFTEEEPAVVADVDETSSET